MAVTPDDTNGSKDASATNDTKSKKETKKDTKGNEVQKVPKLQNIQHSHFKTAFNLYCIRSHSDENLAFFKRAEDIKKRYELEVQTKPNNKANILVNLQEDLAALYNKYVLGTDISLNLSGILKKTIQAEQSQTNGFTITTLIAVMTEIEHLINTGVVNDFAKSPIAQKISLVSELNDQLSKYLQDNAKNKPKKSKCCCCCRTKPTITKANQIYANIALLQAALNAALSQGIKSILEFVAISKKITSALSIHSNLEKNAEDPITRQLRNATKELAEISATPTLTSQTFISTKYPASPSPPPSSGVLSGSGTGSEAPTARQIFSI